MPGVLRWWDGASWTAYSQWMPPAYDAVADLSAEERAARWARVALFGAAVVAILGYLIIAIYFGHEIHRFIHAFREDVRATNEHTAASTPDFGSAGGLLVFDAFEAVGLAAQVLFIVWLYRAATVAARAGLPARHEALWAWLGFLVPIVNFWFPYQVAADALPVGDPSRRRVGWWWGCWLAQGFAAVPIAIVSYFSRSAALVVAIGLSVVPVMAAIQARAMITATIAAHRRILGP